ncbi:MAG: hypothetical protein R2716_10265 [Microthrixaceae bacterium]
MVASALVGWGGLRGRARGLRDRDALKAAMVRRLLTGASARELDRAAGMYAARLLDSGLRPEMVEEIRKHVLAGHGRSSCRRRCGTTSIRSPGTWT